MGEEFSAEAAIAHLVRRGVLPGPGGARARPLPGGVSSDVVLVESAEGRWVVKRPLSRFRVRREWLVDPRRAQAEHRFAKLAWERIGPVVAEPVDFDPDQNLLVTRAAPPSFVAWKSRLLSGNVESAVAGSAGELLARIHRLGPVPGFSNGLLFEQQRLDPYFLTTADAHADVGPALRILARELGRCQDTLIQGDFSPKNLLTDGSRILLVDHEVATIGDPRFDVAFLLAHLLLKAFHGLPAEETSDACDEFLYRYGRGQGPAPRDERLARLVGGLLLCRVDGKSPVEYLRGPEQERVRAFAKAALKDNWSADELLVEAFKRLKA